MFRRQVCVPEHHLVRLPTAQLHELLQPGAGHHVPAGPSVPKLVEAKLLDPGTPQCPFPGRAHRFNASPPIREAPLLVLAVHGSQRQHCIPVQGNAAAVSGLGSARVQPGHTPIEVDTALFHLQDFRGSGRLRPMAASICRRQPGFSRFQLASTIAVQTK